MYKRTDVCAKRKAGWGNVQVKLEFLRMLVRMELGPARMTILTGFFETYLKLNEEEE